MHVQPIFSIPLLTISINIFFFLTWNTYLIFFFCILPCFLVVIKIFSIDIYSMSFLYIQCKFIIKCKEKCKLHFKISINISHVFYKCYPSIYLKISFNLICENITSVFSILFIYIFYNILQYILLKL